MCEVAGVEVNNIAKACSGASLQLENSSHPELALILQMAANEIERLDKLCRLMDANDLLRSTHAITLREGKDTNWEPFRAQLESMLIAQSREMNGTAHLPAATCTAKTFRLPPRNGT